MAKRRAALTVPAVPAVTGLTAADNGIDAQAVYQKAVAEFKKEQALEEKRRHQSITFEHGPVAIAQVADVHLGGNGVDYERAWHEARIIRDTPGLYCLFNGDLFDNFILAKLYHIRLNSSIAIPQEAALGKEYLRILGPKLLVSVRGNHEGWFEILTGIDYFADVMREVSHLCLYDAYDVRFTLKVGKTEFVNRARHKWRGNSIYNPTHMIERAFLFDQDFQVGWGAHTHVSGLTRQFNAAGKTGMAVLAGSYKVIDPYARSKGFSKPNASTAPAVIFEENGQMVGMDNLELAAEWMNRLTNHR